MEANAQNFEYETLEVTVSYALHIGRELGGDRQWITWESSDNVHNVDSVRYHGSRAEALDDIDGRRTLFGLLNDKGVTISENTNAGSYRKDVFELVDDGRVL